MKLTRWSLVCCIVLLLSASSWLHCQQAFPTEPTTDTPDTMSQPKDPVLTHRPPVSAKKTVASESQIGLDVVVVDQAGKPVTGLEPWDFKLLDDNQPRKILSFQRHDGAAAIPDPPVEILLVLDTANLPFQTVSFVRGQLDRFLRRNGGRLQQPLSLIVLDDAGIRMQPRPSFDGNAIAAAASQIKGNVGTLNPAMGGEYYVQRFQLSVKQMLAIAENEAKKPGRKLLIWVGPGWPLLNHPSTGHSEREQKLNFNGIVALSTRLREARIAVYSVAPAGMNGVYGNQLYRQFLRGVPTYREAVSGNLALNVLVTQTGGQILGPSNDLVDLINECVSDANAFYRISFDPASAKLADEYHELKVQVDKPGVTVRTNTGYYNQP